MLTTYQKSILDASSYVKEKFSDKLSTKTSFNEDEMYHIACAYIDSANLGTKINGFEENRGILAGYNTVDKTFSLSLKKARKEAQDTKDFIDTLDLESIFPFLEGLTTEELINPTIISCIIHEVTHAMQLENTPISESDKILQDLAKYFSGSRKYIRYYYIKHLYNKYYFLLPFEREAQVNELIAYDIGNPEKDIKLSILRDLLLESFIMPGYINNETNTCPFDKYKEFIKEPYDENRFSEEVKKMDLLTRITYGYPITDKEFECFSTKPFETTLSLGTTYYKK